MNKISDDAVMTYKLGNFVWLLASLVCLGRIECSYPSEESWKVVEKSCNQRLQQINSIQEFEYFMKHYNVVIETSVKPKRGLLNLESRMRKCFDAKDRLIALGELVEAQKEGVCHMKFINKLLDYHVGYMLDKKHAKQDEPLDSTQIEAASKASTMRTTYDAHFFSLLAHQVALTCKSKLRERLEAVQAKYDCSQVVSKFMPHGDDEPMGELAESFMRQFKRVEDFAPLFGHHGSSDEPYFEVIVSPRSIDKIEALKNLCQQREPHYKSLFSPIALLAQLGYDVDDITSVNQSEADSRTLSCWLSSAQLCQGILKTHLNAKLTDDEKNEADNLTTDKKLVEIKFGKIDQYAEQFELSDADEQGFVDSINEISPEIVAIVKQKQSMKSKFKRKALVWAKNFIESHIDLDAKRKQMMGLFIDELTRDQTHPLDSPVAFGGQKIKTGMFLPARMVTDDADTIVQAGSFFVHKGLAIIISSVVGITLSAVFIWFAIYAAISSCRAHSVPDASGNFKQSWKSSYSERMRKLEDRKNGWKQKMMVYRGT